MLAARLIVGEGAGHLAHPVVPQPARAEIGLRGPVLDLPTDGVARPPLAVLLDDGFYKIPLGNSTFDIPPLDDLRGGMSGFPDKASVEKLRYYGIKTVVLHTDAVKGLPRDARLVDARAAGLRGGRGSRSPGLGVTRRRSARW